MPLLPLYQGTTFGRAEKRRAAASLLPQALGVGVPSTPSSGVMG